MRKAMALNRIGYAKPEVPHDLPGDHRRLQALVGELLQTNQELRFKVGELEKRAESAERGWARACAAAGLLMP